MHHDSSFQVTELIVDLAEWGPIGMAGMELQHLHSHFLLFYSDRYCFLTICLLEDRS